MGFINRSVMCKISYNAFMVGIELIEHPSIFQQQTFIQTYTKLPLLPKRLLPKYNGSFV